MKPSLHYVEQDERSVERYVDEGYDQSHVEQDYGQCVDERDAAYDQRAGEDYDHRRDDELHVEHVIKLPRYVDEGYDQSHVEHDEDYNQSCGEHDGGLS